MKRVLVIGAGIFGCSIASELSHIKGTEIDLIEEQGSILSGASLANHNRLHLGYHYLRCKKTAIQSLEGLLSFLFYFGEAVKFRFPNYYAIAAESSYSNADDFRHFCNEVGISYSSEMPDSKLVNSKLLEECFKVPEPIFDHSKLKSLVGALLERPNIATKLNHKCSHIMRNQSGFEAIINDKIYYYDVVINCSYSNLNFFNKQLGIDPVTVELQDVVIPHFLYPLEPIGITIMDGPFCSIMPKGFNKNEFLLYHVQHSVLARSTSHIEPFELQQHYIDEIYNSSAKFYPFLERAMPHSYWRTTRVIVKNPEDSRISEIHTFPSCPNYIAVLSGKISTCIKVALSIRHNLSGNFNDRGYFI